MEKVRVAAVQFQHAPGDKGANLATVREFAARAAAEGTQMVAFAECCISGYWHLRRLSRADLEALAEHVPDGDSTRELVRLARETGMTIGAGLVEIDPAGGDEESGALYNTYVVAMPTGEVRRHRKLHCFISEHMRSGSEFTVFDTPHGGRVGVLICYDNNIVENVRATALAGADVLLAPHQTGGCALKDPHSMGLVDRALWDARERDPGAIEAELRGSKGRGWLMRWLPSRAHDNGMFLVFSNGIGPDNDEIRTGNAMVLDPYGRVLAETCRAGDDMVVADLEPSLLGTCSGRRWIRARRPELYSSLCRTTSREEDVRKLRFEA
ncbi:MAG: nitrilase family protein [Planctomycetota bacterium]|jgi:predicted amidohydrolase